MADASRKSEVSAALRLLKGVAGELRELASDTARFGEALADDHVIAGANPSIGLLQRFDLFAQNMRAQASLIDCLSTRLEEGSADAAVLHDLIGHVPFFSMRERLSAIVNGTRGETTVPAEDVAEAYWF